MAKSKPIVVQIEGGVVNDVMNIPEGVVVQVVDCDIDGVDDDRLSKWVDKKGKEQDCILYEFDHKGERE